MLNLQTILQTKDFKPQTKITFKWQDRAYQVWKSFYDKYPGQIEQAYSFTFDYEGNVPKLKLFYWKFNQLKK